MIFLNLEKSYLKNITEKKVLCNKIEYKYILLI